MSVKSAKCGRWNPTAEQVKVLSELFRSGLRTPSTDQIQNISDHLSFYGSVESKNVFYWFQNHKARERQRLSLDANNNLSSPKQINHVSEPERVIETLQLFPLNTTYEEPEAEKMRHYAGGEGKENAAYPYNFIGGKDHPPLDLRLSFF